MGLDVYDDIERGMAGGWSDELPVIPPYGSLVEDMLAAMGWDYTDVVGRLPEQSIEVHASHVAVAAAAVMAGCRPEYGPLTRRCSTRRGGGDDRRRVRHGARQRPGGWSGTGSPTRPTAWVPTTGPTRPLAGSRRWSATSAAAGAARLSRTVRMLTRLTGLAPSSVVVSGHDVGHIGPADIIVGFDRLRRADQLDAPVAVASSPPCSFGFGLITPPATPSAG